MIKFEARFSRIISLGRVYLENHDILLSKPNSYHLSIIKQLKNVYIRIIIGIYQLAYNKIECNENHFCVTQSLVLIYLKFSSYLAVEFRILNIGSFRNYFKNSVELHNYHMEYICSGTHKAIIFLIK